MNSKERFLAAVRCQPVDRPPLYLRLWSLGEMDCIPFNWRNPVTRAETLLALGIDDTLLLEPPLGYTENYTADLVPGVEAVVEAEPEDLLRKTYHTPAGPLSMAVRRTPDWPCGADVPLFSDFNVPRFVKPPVQSADDLPALRAVLGDPSPAQVAAFRLEARRLRGEADRLGVALDGGWTALGDSVVWMCGMERLLLGQMEEPALIEALLDVLLDWELKRADLLIEAGIDELVHMAWYEGTDFWTPKNYRRMLRPRLQQLIDRAHRAGIPFRYIITRGWKPLAKDFLEMGIDCLTGVDPVQDRLTLAEARDLVGGRICLMGGMNSAVTLMQGTETEIRAAVDEALRILAPGGGFILYPVDAVFCEMDWKRVEIVVDQWKKSWQEKEVNGAP
jgi:uroporphyrinogen-III decarboxylase